MLTPRATSATGRPPATYAEGVLPGAAADVCEASWAVVVDQATDDWLVLPDGCVDLVLVPGAAPAVAGPATAASVFSQAAGTHAAGLRLLPGAAPAVLGVGAGELVDQLIALDQLGAAWRPRLAPAQALLDAGRALEARAALAVAVAAAPRRRAPDPVARRAAELLRRDPGLPVGTVAAALSLSVRQLHRRFVAHVGYGPKRFARVMRLQRLLALRRRNPDAGLAWLAARAGYADQAHLARDCRALAGRTPTALLAQRASVAFGEDGR